MPAQLCMLWIALIEIAHHMTDIHWLCIPTYKVGNLHICSPLLKRKSNSRAKKSAVCLRIIIGRNKKKFHFQQQQHIGLLIMLVEFQLLISAFLSLYDICYWTKWYFISLYQNMKRVQSYKNGVGVFWKLCHSPISLLWLELAYKL